MSKTSTCRMLAAFATVAAFGAGIAATRQAQGAENTPVTIAGELSLTGVAGQIGVDVQHGAQIAVNEINAAGGILGHPVEFFAQDTVLQPAQAVQLFNAYSSNPKVIAVLGPVSAPEVGAVTNLAAAKKLVAFAPVSAGAVPGLPDLKFNPWTFRLNQPLPSVVGPMVTKVIEITHAKVATVLNYSNDSAYVNVGDLFDGGAKAAHLEVQRIQFPTTTQDYSAILTQINRNTDLIAIGALAATDGALVRAIRQAGLKANIVGDASMLTSSVYTVSEGGTKGAYAYSTFLKGFGTGTDAFIAAYKKAYGAEPSSLAAYGYDAVKLIAHAAETEKSMTRQAIRDGLGATRHYQGVTGEITYDNSGDAVRSSVPLVQVVDGGGIEKIGDIPIK